MQLKFAKKHILVEFGKIIVIWPFIFKDKYKTAEESSQDTGNEY